MCEPRFYVICNAGQLTRFATFTEALAASKETPVSGSGVLWLDFHRPTSEDFAPLMEPLGLHPLAIEDCLDNNQVPKIEDFPYNTFIIFNAFNYEGSRLTVDEVDLFIGENFVITTCGHATAQEGVQAPPPLADAQRGPLTGIERIVERDIQSACQGPSFLLHIILDHIVDHKFAAIETLEDEMDRAEETILSDLSNFNAADLLRLRRDLLALRKSLFHEREILVKICRKDCRFIAEQALFHYRDIYDHLAKFFELTENYRDIVASLTEMYLSMLNNQMSKSANDMNATIRRLTIITTIFMPLTLLAGIGGMSEWSMMTGAENWRITYPAFLLAMAIIGVVNYILLKWLERRGQRLQSPRRLQKQEEAQVIHE